VQDKCCEECLFSQIKSKAPARAGGGEEKDDE